MNKSRPWQPGQTVGARNLKVGTWDPNKDMTSEFLENRIGRDSLGNLPHGLTNEVWDLTLGLCVLARIYTTFAYMLSRLISAYDIGSYVFRGAPQILIAYDIGSTKSFLPCSIIIFLFLQLPWKTLKQIIEYYYMWKTTDRYVQQKRVKAVEAELKLKQVYIPQYNATTKSGGGGAAAATKGAINIYNGTTNGGADVSNMGKPCESCLNMKSTQVRQQLLVAIFIS